MKKRGAAGRHLLPSSARACPSWKSALERDDNECAFWSSSCPALELGGCRLWVQRPCQVFSQVSLRPRLPHLPFALLPPPH